MDPAARGRHEVRIPGRHEIRRDEEWRATSVYRQAVQERTSSPARDPAAERMGRMNRRDFIKSAAVTALAPSIIGNVAEPKPPILDLSPWLVTIHSWGVPVIQPFIMYPLPPPTAIQLDLERQFKCVFKSPSHAPLWIENSEHLPTVRDLSERVGKIDYKSQNLSDWKRLPGCIVLMGGNVYQFFRAACFVPPVQEWKFFKFSVAAKSTDTGYLWTLIPSLTP